MGHPYQDERLDPVISLPRFFPQEWIPDVRVAKTRDEVADRSYEIRLADAALEATERGDHRHEDVDWEVAERLYPTGVALGVALRGEGDDWRAAAAAFDCTAREQAVRETCERSPSDGLVAILDAWIRPLDLDRTTRVD